ncbi:MAG: ATP-binding cassette domain-containing protein [Cyanobacteria bacterium HKST-UBA01]|nr:ATP-binding cassette domain-containing protein [Cyanobacteria bacterium HKST-UBA01]
MIKAEDLTRKYGDLVAVDSASFQIEHGEIVGLLGHNGAGKTTIMKMITGFIEPTAGKLTVDGLDICEDRSKIQKKIGYLPENCPLYPEMTVADYLVYAASLKGLEGAEANSSIAQAIHRTRLTDVAAQRINTLSRGYRQRLGVAQAILGSPRIYILDEPTNGLDPSQILEMRALIKELAQKATVVVSTHILQEVEATCHRVIIVRGGKIALDSTMKNLDQSNRLEVVLGPVSDSEQESEEAVSAMRALLEEVEGVEEASVLEQHFDDERATFSLSLTADKERDPVAAAIATRVVEKGLKLYALKPKVRDLEVIFGEISRGVGQDE